MSNPTFAPHPVIRVVSLLVLGGFVALGSVAQLLAAGVLLAAGYALHYAAAQASTPQVAPLMAMLLRMRWLFLSLFILYFWFTPGEPLFPAASANLQTYLPTVQGVQAGLARAAALLLLALAVALLLRSTPRAQLVAALYWLVRPLNALGVAADRIALRVVLILEVVTEAQHLLTRCAPPSKGRALERIGHFAATLFQESIDRAERSPAHVVEIDDYSAPPRRQWLYPLALGGMFWMTTRF